MQLVTFSKFIDRIGSANISHLPSAIFHLQVNKIYHIIHINAHQDPLIRKVLYNTPDGYLWNMRNIEAFNYEERSERLHNWFAKVEQQVSTSHIYTQASKEETLLGYCSICLPHRCGFWMVSRCQLQIWDVRKSVKIQSRKSSIQIVPCIRLGI